MIQEAALSANVKQVGVAGGIAARVVQRKIHGTRHRGVEQLQANALVFADVKHRGGIRGGRAIVTGQRRNLAVAQKEFAGFSGRAALAVITVRQAEDAVLTKLYQGVEAVIRPTDDFSHRPVGEADVRHDQRKRAVRPGDHIRRDERRFVAVMHDDRAIHAAVGGRARQHVRVIPKQSRARHDEPVGVSLAGQNGILRHGGAVAVVVQFEAMPVDGRAFDIVGEIVFEMANDRLTHVQLDQRRGNSTRRPAAARRVVHVHQHAHVRAIECRGDVGGRDVELIRQGGIGADVRHLGQRGRIRGELAGFRQHQCRDQHNYKRLPCLHNFSSFRVWLYSLPSMH